MRAYTGAVILYDALPSGNANGLNTPVWIARQRFGITDANVQYIGPWRKDAGLSCDAADVHLAAWKKPGAVLVAVVNYGEAAKAAVKIDGEKLSIGQSNTWKVTDAEEGTAARSKHDPATGKQIPGWKAEDEAPISHDGKGTLTVPVSRHSYRLVTIAGDGSK